MLSFVIIFRAPFDGTQSAYSFPLSANHQPFQRSKYVYFRRDKVRFCEVRASDFFASDVRFYQVPESDRPGCNWLY